eukprot:gene13648-20997_t
MQQTCAWETVAASVGYHEALPALSDLLTRLVGQARAAAPGDAASAVFVREGKCEGGGAGEPVARLLQALARGAGCSPEVFVTLAMLLDRASAAVELTRATVEKLVASAFLVALKTHDDAYHAMSFYAAQADLPLHELLAAERAFLTAIDWDVSVDPADFARYESNLVAATRAVERRRK